VHVQPHHTVQELEKLCKQEKTARVAQRLRAVILAQRGRDAPTIARDLGRSRRAVQDWIACYNREGVEGLRDAPRPGKPPKLSARQEQQLCAWLDAGPDPHAPVCTRRGPEIRAHIHTAFGVKFSVSGAYDLLHRLGYSALRPRSRHRKADAAAQERFKADAPLLFTACGESGPAGSFRSGSRTRPVWASRAR
jgi:putative transposase